MDLNTVSEVARPKARAELDGSRDGDAWLAGGTWLFSEPQPGVRRLVDLEGLGWRPLTATEEGLEIAATCTLAQLHAFEAPADWRAAPLFRECCRALLASFKVWNAATVGGNVCMSLPAGGLISLTTALEGICVVWLREGGERRIPVEEFVTGNHQNVLRQGDLLRLIWLPASALRKQASFRRVSLTHLGRSTVLLIGTLSPEDGKFALAVTAATVRPLRLEMPAVPSAEGLAARLREAIPDELWFDDVHGSPAYRKHMTFHLAEEIRRELAAREAV